ncbi:hypothetical protein DL771_009545 [Monosporascus sp. 5C6A]|nr:hypothetical protein DL771_009545 [Monosporascus sp. 5C6A]
MPKFPPVEKLPPAVRKNGGIEKQLSDLLTVLWTVDIHPNQVYLIFFCSYVEGAIQGLKEFVGNYGPDGVQELNSICSTHVLIIDLDEARQFSFCGTDVHKGRLRALFADGYLEANIDDALGRNALLKAPNDAAGVGLRRGAKLRGADGHPHFEDTFAKLLAESKVRKRELRPDWQGYLGYFTLLYWEAIVTQLKW